MELKVLEWDKLIGPGTIPCEEKCVVPAGVRMVAYPSTRHGWPGVRNCPNNCGRSFEMYRIDR